MFAMPAPQGNHRNCPRGDGIESLTNDLYYSNAELPDFRLHAYSCADSVDRSAASSASLCSGLPILMRM
jgi:hypothetical protein